VTTTTRRVHIVRQGDTAWSISQRFNVTLPALLAANGLTRRSTLRPGQTLRIP
jgi:LysM repeat protein